ncbi:hypothetical protein [Alteromonas gracilis]|uniref:hypothetical protein n=1 Tax=Alteromonas gracilis TaxID=1479524 RepID=UPI0036F3CBA2
MSTSIVFDSLLMETEHQHAVLLLSLPIKGSERGLIRRFTLHLTQVFTISQHLIKIK